MINVHAMTRYVIVWLVSMSAAASACSQTHVFPPGDGGGGAAGQTCAAGDCESPCMPASIEACYTGHPGTLGVGACKAGNKVCGADGTAYSACEGEVTPTPERCDDLIDNDCNGTANDGCVVYSSCNSVPAGSPSGVYTLNPGNGQVNPFLAYCDMVTEGGGWSLVASAVNGEYFKRVTCWVDANGGGTKCDETPFSSATTHGDVSTRLTQDYKSESYSTVPFRDFMFMDSNGHYAVYHIADANLLSVHDWYPVGLQNYVPQNTEEHLWYTYPVKATNMNASLNNCGTLRLSFNVEDSDTPIGAPYHDASRGPAWSLVGNNMCYWDDGGIPWATGAFFQTNATSYRLWFVR